MFLSRLERFDASLPNHLIMGCDPGVHEAAFFWRIGGKYHYCVVASDHKALADPMQMASPTGLIPALRKAIAGGIIPAAANTLVVEGQEVYRNKKHINPNDIRRLAFASGLVAMAVDHQAIYCPAPVAWKGNVHKAIHHQRIAARLGISVMLSKGKDPYAIPLTKEDWLRAGQQHDNVNKGDWKHLFDAAGLMIHGIESMRIL